MDSSGCDVSANNNCSSSSSSSNDNGTIGKRKHCMMQDSNNNSTVAAGYATSIRFNLEQLITLDSEQRQIQQQQQRHQPQQRSNCSSAASQQQHLTTNEAPTNETTNEHLIASNVTNCSHTTNADNNNNNDNGSNNSNNSNNCNSCNSCISRQQQACLDGGQTDCVSMMADHGGHHAGLRNSNLFECSYNYNMSNNSNNVNDGDVLLVAPQTMGRLFDSLQDYVRSKRQMRYKVEKYDENDRAEDHDWLPVHLSSSQNNATTNTNNNNNNNKTAKTATRNACSNIFKCAFNYDNCPSSSSSHNDDNINSSNKSNNNSLQLGDSLKRYAKQTFFIKHHKHHSSSQNNHHHHHHNRLINYKLSPSILLAMLFSFLLTASLVCLLTLHCNTTSNYLNDTNVTNANSTLVPTIVQLNDHSLNEIISATTTHFDTREAKLETGSEHQQPSNTNSHESSSTTSDRNVAGVRQVTHRKLRSEQQQRQIVSKTDDDRYSNKGQQQQYQVANSLSHFDEARSVQTECGKFVGLIEHEAIVFRGIAYALAPIKRRRWQRPIPIWEANSQLAQQQQPADNNLPAGFSKVSAMLTGEPNQDNNDSANNSDDKQSDSNQWQASTEQQSCQPNRVLEAHRHAPVCLQLSPLSHTFIGSENCLYLDIWAPRLDTKRRPVMVYIHGGFLSFGSSGQSQANLFDVGPSSELALAMDCVIVSFNYRLQALGFLTLEQLANSNPNSSLGNYGLWDQLCALRWIKRNIVQFGGDPNNIVLFGPDSASALPLAFLSNEMRANDNDERDYQAGDNNNAGDNADNNGDNYGDNYYGDSWLARDTPTSSAPIGGNLDDKRQTEQRPDIAAGEQLIEDDRHLYHAVWLTNPSLYFDVPFAVSAKHNGHTFLHNLPNCLPADAVDRQSQPQAQPQALAPMQSNQSSSDQQRQIAEAKRQTTSKQQTNEQLATMSAGQDVTQLGAQRQQNNRLLDCLYSMSAEQIIRHFLGQDEPSYRLDDQNDLPIHGILADQLVVVDGELISNLFPFSARQSASGRRGASLSFAATAAGALAVGSGTPGGQFNKSRLTTSLESSVGAEQQTRQQHYDRHRRPRRPPQQRPCAQVDTSGTGDYEQANQANRQTKRTISFGAKKKRILIGSSQQAVEYWPCPRDLAQWSWQDYTRYVITSLNSFSSQAVKAANKWYAHILDDDQSKTSSTRRPTSGGEVNNNYDNNNTITNDNYTSNYHTLSNETTSPMEEYLTLVSDIRQICPVNEMARELNQWAHKTTTVHRYIIDHRPDRPIKITSASQQAANLVAGKQSNHQLPIGYEPQLAFHMWDLMAFFNVTPSKTNGQPLFVSQNEVKFQQQIRQLIKAFVHQQPSSSTWSASGQQQQLLDAWLLSNTVDSNNYNQRTNHNQINNKIAVMGRDANWKMQDTYKYDECKMWRKYLGRDYAWVS